MPPSFLAPADVSEGEELDRPTVPFAFLAHLKTNPFIALFFVFLFKTRSEQNLTDWRLWPASFVCLSQG
jgi:hypothetical protein